MLNNAMASASRNARARYTFPLSFQSRSVNIKCEVIKKSTDYAGNPRGASHVTYGFRLHNENAYFRQIKSIKMPGPLVLQIVFILLLAFITPVFGQMRIVSLGVHAGLTSTYTWDEGIYADPRYKNRYDLKFVPVGFNYGVDYEGFGFVISPCLLMTGQNFYLVNTVGGHEGTRKIDLQYLSVPIALKFHVIDLDFLKTSFVAGAGPAYLVRGSDRITHDRAKLYFPPAVYPSLPDSYVIEYDGVQSPEVQKLEILTKKDFDPLQIFAFMGIRSDWYFSDNWKASFDFRANYTIFDNRTDEYLQRAEAYETIYDMPGKRRDITGVFTLGVSRYIEIEMSEKKRKVHIKSNTKKYVPPKKLPRPPIKRSKLRN